MSFISWGLLHIRPVCDSLMLNHKKLSNVSLIAIFVSSFCPFCLVSQEQSEKLKIFHNAIVHTVDDSTPQANAIAVRGDKIIAVGSNEKVLALRADGAEVIDLKGKTVIPGFIEGHAHFTGIGQSMMMLDLRNANVWEDIVDQVKQAVESTPESVWIVGRGWHQSKWERVPEPNVEKYPVHDALSKISPKNPVLLTHASGHMCFANAAAMKLAGVDNETRDPDGGEILRDAGGNPTGIFRETAMGLVSRAKAISERRQTREQVQDYFEQSVVLATQECLSKGITSFQDAGSSLDTISRFKKLAEKGDLGIRLWVMVRDSNTAMRGRLKKFRMIDVGKNRLTVRAIKRAIDGALGAHGAWLLEPYEDLSSSAGLNTSSIKSIEETASLAIENDFQLCVHAIGDRANRETLDLFQRHFEKKPTKESRRWRVEHAQHLHPNDIPRFQELGVIASMQGVHCTSDAIFVPTRLGMRRSKQGAYVWRSLLESGAVVINGTDAPVEDVNPIHSFYASVTRKLKSGEVFFEEECMTREQALKSYTLSAAYAAFEEKQKGSIEVGKLADFVVLSNDIMTCPDEHIRETNVLRTVLGGETVYQSK